jgi:uncharacterized protein (DUF486 family)
MNAYVWPVILLILSNAFMTAAWYGHLKYPKTSLIAVVVVSWGIAFFEYCFQVPANRIGHQAGTSAGQLKVMQEVITLVVFVLFARWWLGEKLTWNYYVAFALILAAVYFVFAFGEKKSPQISQTVEEKHATQRH